MQYDATRFARAEEPADLFKLAFHGCSMEMVSGITLPVEGVTDGDLTGYRVLGVYSPVVADWYMADRIAGGEVESGG